MGFFDWLFGRKPKQPEPKVESMTEPKVIVNDSQENAMVNSSVKPKRYRKPKYDYRENYYQIITVLDNSTCSKCGKMDLRVYKESEKEIGVNCPPFHDDCRCDVVPWFGDEPVGQRAARDENGKSIYVPANMTWTKWRKLYGGKNE